MWKNFLRRIIPKKILLFYHKILAYLAAFFYGWPTQKMIVIGVTGTKGKSTVVNLIGKILESAGYQVGWTSTINFKIGKREWLNKTKMTMLGRFKLQKILKQMLKASCQYAIIETSSEGIVQSRHLGINYDVVLLTNLYPEHLESHGGFENYKKAKGELFKHLTRLKRKTINGQKILKKIIVNLDDPKAEYFLSFPADEYWGYTTKISQENRDFKIQIIKGEKIQLDSNGSKFFIQNLEFKTSLLGEFNVYNALAAITAAVSQGIDLKICRQGLEKINGLAGRLEEIKEGQNFKIFVDYAHTPNSLEAVYQLISKIKFPESRIIAVFGACGGGRDKWKRPVMGKIAAKYCDIIILTNEDPYDEDPNQILSEIKTGIQNSKFNLQNLYEILDRKLAIKKAIELAKKDDIVVITGKGSEQVMMIGDKKIPWDDREVVKEILRFKNFSLACG